MPAKAGGKAGGKSGGKGKSAKVVKAPRAKGAKKGKRKATRTWSLYIFKVLKQVHSDTGISNKAMNIMNSFINDIFDRLATEGSVLAMVLLALLGGLWWGDSKFAFNSSKGTPSAHNCERFFKNRLIACLGGGLHPPTPGH